MNESAPLSTSEDKIFESEKKREIKEAHRALREFVESEENKTRSSGHFLPGRGIEMGFDQSQVPDDEVVIFWKANKHEITDEEFRSYREKLLDERGVIKTDVNPSRHALLQYVNNMMMVIQGRRYLEAEQKRLESEENQN